MVCFWFYCYTSELLYGLLKSFAKHFHIVCWVYTHFYFSLMSFKTNVFFYTFCLTLGNFSVFFFMSFLSRARDIFSVLQRKYNVLVIVCCMWRYKNCNCTVCFWASIIKNKLSNDNNWKRRTENLIGKLKHCGRMLPYLCLTEHIKWPWHQQRCHAYLNYISLLDEKLVVTQLNSDNGMKLRRPALLHINNAQPIGTHMRRTGEVGGMTTYCEVLHQLLLKRVLFSFYPYALICQKEEVNRAMPSKG